MKSAFDATISGRVQMVMFRDFAKRHADQLSLTGEVKNMPNKTIWVHAEGEKENLETLIEFLKKGPFLAQVEDVHVVWSNPMGTFDTFSIRY